MKSFVTIFFIAITTSAFCQNGEISISPIPITLFDNPSGIRHMAQDKFGHIWLAHDVNGIVRYDGEYVVWYAPDADDPDAIIGGRLEELFIDNRGHIWISTLRDGIEKFDPETEIFTHIRHDANDPKSLRSNTVRAFIQDDEGFIWFGTNIGLDKYDPKTGEFIHVFSKDPDFKLVDKESVWELYQDKSGNIWIGCGTTWDGNKTKGGLYKYDKKTDEITPYFHSEKTTSLIDNRITEIFEDSRGTVWVGTAGDGLHTMDRELGTFERHEYDPLNPQKLSRPPIGDLYTYADDHITFIEEDEFGNIWIGTFEGGINRYNLSSGTTTYFGMNEFGTKSFINGIKTHDNLLWLASWGPSISGEDLFKISTSPQKLEYRFVGPRNIYAIVETKDKSILLGTQQGLMLMDTNAQIQEISFNNDILDSGPRVNMLKKDEFDNIWISTIQGLYKYNNETKEVRTFRHNPGDQNSISSDDVNETLLIDEDHLLIATGQGLNLLNLKNGDCKKYFHDGNDVNTISHDDIWELRRDHDNNIWISTEGGINKFDIKTGLFKRYEDPFIVNRRIIIDGKNNVWVGTSGMGLWLYHEVSDQFKPYLDHTSILTSSMDLFGITEDRYNNLWMKANLGFIRLNPSNGKAILFGKSWGQAAGRFGRGIFTTTAGDILIANNNGIVRFNPEDYLKEVQNIDPYIYKLYVDNQLVLPDGQDFLSKPISQTDEITLKHFQNDFALEFGHVDFRTAPIEHLVQFRLENYDEVWRQNERGNKASYYGVPPGKYVFKVRASNVNGVWTEKSLAITILGPWYKSWWAYLLFFVSGLAIIRAFIVFRERQLTIENKRLEEKIKLRTIELQKAKSEVEKSLETLKSTQAQLIQSEKMASLGELTAGIAHEIQNPLNFVNNFSDVSSELIDEMKEELENGDKNEAIEIANDLKQNLEKISHHGKRADSIVKGMLLHSRTSAGKKEPTDINALADEYLRLSYHGLRAKNKSFNSNYKTDFDDTIGAVEVIPQDIGRVLLNLFNNAFHAVSSKALDPAKAHSETYQPTVTVSTRRLNPKEIQISVSDNGNGIPDSIKDKIFQPFFTTKATGEGTGLGLSLSYDIVKAHGGVLKVKSVVGEGTEFVITLPV